MCPQHERHHPHPHPHHRRYKSAFPNSFVHVVDTLHLCLRQFERIIYCCIASIKMLLMKAIRSEDDVNKLIVRTIKSCTNGRLSPYYKTREELSFGSWYLDQRLMFLREVDLFAFFLDQRVVHLLDDANDVQYIEMWKLLMKKSIELKDLLRDPAKTYPSEESRDNLQTFIDSYCDLYRKCLGTEQVVCYTHLLKVSLHNY